MEKLILSLLFVNVLILFSPQVTGATYTGKTPVEREDGTKLLLNEIAGFNVYCGAVPGDYTTDQFFPGATEGTTTLNDLILPPGISYCVVTTIDTKDRESKFSNEITFNIDAEALPMEMEIVPGLIINITVILPSTGN